MQDCNKCGKKIKTLYERFGASGKFEAVGYYCNRCSIFYPKNVASQPAQAVYRNEQDSILSKAKLYTDTSELVATVRHEKSGPEGLRSLGLRFRRPPRYPDYATGPQAINE